MDKGELVPDEVMVNLVSSELKKLGDQSWLLDGFPRTQPQAAALQSETPVNVVVNLDVPFETIIDRVKDRWVHPASGRIYNTVFNPPKVPGKDDCLKWYIQIHHYVDRGFALQSSCLRLCSRETIQKPGLVTKLFQLRRDKIDHHFIRHKFSFVHESFGFLANRSPLVDIMPKKVP